MVFQNVINNTRSSINYYVDVDFFEDWANDIEEATRKLIKYTYRFINISYNFVVNDLYLLGYNGILDSYSITSDGVLNFGTYLRSGLSNFFDLILDNSLVEAAERLGRMFYNQLISRANVIARQIEIKALMALNEAQSKMIQSRIPIIDDIENYGTKIYKDTTQYFDGEFQDNLSNMEDIANGASGKIVDNTNIFKNEMVDIGTNIENSMKEQGQLAVDNLESIVKSTQGMVEGAFDWFLDPDTWGLDEVNDAFNSFQSLFDSITGKKGNSNKKLEDSDELDRNQQELISKEHERNPEYDVDPINLFITPKSVESMSNTNNTFNSKFLLKQQLKKLIIKKVVVILLLLFIIYIFKICIMEKKIK